MTAERTSASRQANELDDDAGADLRAARRVLELEAEGLSALSETLDDRFAAAVEILAAVDGRVIVCGMGKSGHIAKKIAATMASTGTPASFVHPGEASHGDLGMIAKGDAVLILSNSGETPELGDVVAYSRRFAIPLVAIVGKQASTLGDAADVALVLPDAAEACPLGLAPTTSTTMALGLGDALAVALLERQGFSSDNFQVFHPGGQLGRGLVKVADIMHTDSAVPFVSPATPMSEAILEMTAKTFGCVGVIEGGKLTGIITDGDLRRNMGDALLACRAGEVMTAGPKTIQADALAAEAVGIMNAAGITSLFVVDGEGGGVSGIIHLHDCLRAGIV